MNTQPTPLTPKELTMLAELLARAAHQARATLPRNIADRFTHAGDAVARLGGGK